MLFQVDAEKMCIYACVRFISNQDYFPRRLLLYVSRIYAVLTSVVSLIGNLCNAASLPNYPCRESHEMCGLPVRSASLNQNSQVFFMQLLVALPIGEGIVPAANQTDKTSTCIAKIHINCIVYKDE